MKRFLTSVNQRLPTILLVLGACGISGGVAMLCGAAAGVIAAGAFCLTAGVLMTRGGDGNEPA